MASRRSKRYANRRRQAKQLKHDKQLQMESLEQRVLLAGNTSSDIAQVISVVPQPITRAANGRLTQATNQIVVHFNDVDLLDGPSSAENPALYQLIFTNDTITNTDDVIHNPIAVSYNATTDRAVLSFDTDLANRAENGGAFRLRINTRLGLPTEPTIISAGDDAAGSSFTTAASATNQAGDILAGATIIDAAIEPQDFPLNFPGADNEPGMRDLPLDEEGLGQPHFSVEDPADSTTGITTLAYNFRSVYGQDPAGNDLQNAITPNQKDRAREIFDIYGSRLGVQFYETEDEGITVVTGDLRAIKTSELVSGEGEILAASGSVSELDDIPTAIMDLSELWDDSFGGNWYQAAMGEIGRLLGMGVTPEISGSSVTGNISESEATNVSAGVDPNGFASLGDDSQFGIVAERIYPGDAAIVLGQHLHRPDAIDIDLYRFQLTTSGNFSAETIAERLPDSSHLDTMLTLFDVNGEVIARNDDYFSEDSLIDLVLDSGTYYIGVSASGNQDYDPVIENTGLNGTSEGPYRLRLDFEPASTQSLIDTLGRPLDGDGDGEAGGVYNFWFEANSPDRTIYVDKSAAGGGDGSLGSPFNQLDVALDFDSRPGDARDIVRIVGNGGADRDLNTLGDNLAYELGFDNFGELADGDALIVPQDVTVMIDEGAIFKMRRSYVQVGSSTTNIDRSGAALQILGTPDADVIFTSREDEMVGVDNDPLDTVAESGEWGGIIIQNDIDRSDFKLDPDTQAPNDFEAKGIFLNHINHADLRFGGGNVTIDSVQQVINPIHLIDARPTITFNDISDSADAAMSANPDSFEESRFHAVDSLAVDYQAVPFTSDYDRVGPDILGNRLIDNTTNGISIRIDTLPGNRLEEMTVSGRFDDTDIVHVVKENLIIGSTPGGPIAVGEDGLQARTDAQLVVDPGIIVKLEGARIEAELSAQIIAEGTESKPVVFTSLNDPRFGGITETSRAAQPGDWGGIYAGHSSRLSLSDAIVAFGGGVTRIPGSSAAFNAIEIHQAESARIANTTLENNASGVGGIAEEQRAGRGTNGPGAIFVRGAQPVIIANTITTTSGTRAAAINIDPNSLNATSLADYGRSRGELERFVGFDDNQGALIRQNILDGNTINGMVVRPAVITTESVWDDADIVHVMFDQIVATNFFSAGGIRLESSPNQSLIVKLDGQQAGFTTTGTPLEISDRIGGILNIIGQPGNPVVLTSLADDSVGAGLGLDGRVQNDTDEGVFTRPARTEERGSFQIDLNFGPVIREHPDLVAAVERAARLWEKIIEDPVTVTIDFELDAPAPPNTPGRAEGSLQIPINTGQITLITTETTEVAFDRLVSLMQADARPHENLVDELPSLDSIEVDFPNTPENPFRLDDAISLNHANYKALFNSDVPQDVQVVSDFDANEARDGHVLIAEGAFALAGVGVGPTFYDADRSDGLRVGEADLVGVLASSIADVLGFRSSLEDINFMLQNPGVQRDVQITPFDLFRLEPGRGGENFQEAERALDPNQQTHVFYDGGIFDPQDLPNELRLETGDIPLSQVAGTTAYADHAAVGSFLGINQPGIDLDLEYFISDQDRTVFDLIGYDVVGGPISGDWRGLTFETYTHDRNVAVNTEFEDVNDASGPNNVPSGAQFLGTIAPNANDSDENRRTALEVHGFINQPSDVDVYSFDAVPGTEVWLDIDRTSQALDAVVELIDANGITLARSDNTLAETEGTEERFEAVNVSTFNLNKSIFLSTDHYSVNPLDPGMRIVLPGSSPEPVTYHLRVRSSSDDLTILNGGLTEGRYELQIRTEELDEVAGTSVQYADIRYAIDGIRVTGLPRHSPLTGEVREDGSNNDTIVFDTPFDGPLDSDDPPAVFEAFSRKPGAIFPRPLFGLNTSAATSQFPNPQFIGNILSSDLGSVTVTGKLEPAPGLDLDIDYYMFSVDYNGVQSSGQFSPPEFVDLVIDMDYADGLGRPDVSVFVYDALVDGEFNVSLGSLVYRGTDTTDLDDVPLPNTGNGLTDLSRGSVGFLDPMIGPIRVEEGTYVLAVVPSNVVPAGIDSQFEDQLPVNPFARVEPVSIVGRIVDQTFDVPPTEEPELPVLIDDSSFVPFNLSDIGLYVSAQEGNETVLYTVDAFQGTVETRVGELFFGNRNFDPNDPNNPNNPNNPGNNPNDPNNPGGGARDWAIGDFVIGELEADPVFNPNNQPVTGRVNEQFFAFSLGLDDEDSGNYMAINPADATFQGVFVDQQGGVDPNDPIIRTLSDDTIETYSPDDFVPPNAVRTDDMNGPGTGEGVQFNALALLQEGRRNYTGYAIGHRNFERIDNILYQYDHGTGQVTEIRQDAFIPTIPPPPDPLPPDYVEPDPPLHAQTDKQERGVLLTDADEVPGDDTALVVVAPTDPDGDVNIRDGDTLIIGTPNAAPPQSFTLEFDTGPDALVNANPSDGVFVRDGERIQVGGVNYEVETGQVLVIDDDLTGLADGGTITIQDIRDNVPPIVLELDNNEDVTQGNIPLSMNFLTGTELAAELVNVVNGLSGSAQATSVNGRVSFVFDGGIEANSPALSVEGAQGVAEGNEILVAEEFYTSTQLIGAIKAVVPGSVSKGNRLSFPGATGASFRDFRNSGVFEDLNGAPGILADVAVPFSPDMTDHELAQAIADAVNGAGIVSATATGSVVTVPPSTEPTSQWVWDASRPFQVEGAAPGGRLQGMEFVGDRTPVLTGSSLADLDIQVSVALQRIGAVPAVYDVTTDSRGNWAIDPDVDVPVSGEFPLTAYGDTLEVSTITSGRVTVETVDIVADRMFAVSESGGLFEIFEYEGAGTAKADYLETSAELLGISFSGLTRGPARLQDGRFADLFFAVDERGNIHAFDQQGVLQDIFADGTSSIETGLDDANGLSFSSLDTNLWHQTDVRNDDIGHGPAPVFDEDDIPLPYEEAGVFEDCTNTTSGAICLGGNSLHFGDSNLNDVENRNFDYPGGAQGSIITNEIDLSDYTSSDSPALYFNYFLVAEETDAIFNQITGQLEFPMRDAFRVYIADDSAGAVGQGQWHLLATNDTIPDPENPIETMLQPEDFDNDPDDGIDIEVQPLFNNSYQESPRLRRPQNGDENTPDIAIGPNFTRDAFPYVDDDTSPFPDVSQVEDNAWNAFPELNETQGVWRQARIDLSEFAGSDSLRLRFDFSTAASFDLGNLGGIELKAVPGEDLRDGDTFIIGGQTFEVDLDTTVVHPAGTSVLDGEVLMLQTVAGEVHRLEFDVDADVQEGNIPVPYILDCGADIVAGSLARAIEDAGLDIETFISGNRVALSGVAAAFVDPDSLLEIEGGLFGALPGVTPGHVPVQLNNAMTADEVAEALVPVFAETFANGVEDVIITHENIVRLFGVEVDDRGPFGLADELRGDEWGAFYNLNGLNDDPFRLQNNTARLYDFDNNGVLTVADPQVDFEVQFEAVFIDDIIIGFSSRGEQLSDHRVPYAYDDPDLPPFDRDGRIPNVFAGTSSSGVLEFDEESEAVTVGEYQVEIRTTTQGISNINKLNRLTPNVTLLAPAGVSVFDGKLFEITDGRDGAVFEYNDLALGVPNAVAPGNFAVNFNVTDTAFELAASIRDAINQAAATGALDLIATTADGNTDVGAVTTQSERINLFGEASVVELEAPNGIEFLQFDVEASSNRTREQGQLVIAQSTITNSEGHGVIVEDALRDLPSYVWEDPNQREQHAQFSEGDYIPHPGPVRHLREVNDENLATGVTITSNVIAFNEEGGIKYEGDPNGFVLVAPCAAQPADPCAERIDGNLFTVTDHNDLTRTFEFHDLQINNPAVPGQDWNPNNVLVEFDRDVCAIDPFDYQSRYCGAMVDMMDQLAIALERSNLDINVYRGKGDEIFIEGASQILGLGDYVSPVQTGQVPFGRIVNNTIVGLGGQFTDARVDEVASIDPNAIGEILRVVDDFQDVGIELGDNADPTLLNNVIVNFEVGLRSDFTTIDTVRDGLLFQANNLNSRNTKVGDFAILLDPEDPLFVDLTNGNFYPAPLSRAIDSSIDSLEERPALASVKDPVGLARSPILAPNRDVLGQLREDDPSVEPQNGQGRNAFKDRGAIDRVDFVGPRVSLLNPRDNDAAGIDQDPRVTFVALAPDVVLGSFDIQFSDSSQLGDALDGTGVDPFSISAESVSVTQDGEPLAAGDDFTLDFDNTNSVLRIIPASGTWPAGNTYIVSLDEEIVQDIAGNPLQANQADGGVWFNITTLLGTDYGDAPVSYPSASHDIVEGFSLGLTVDPDNADQPSPEANIDSDDGVNFPEALDRNEPNSITVQATAIGRLDAWIDFNQDGDWNDEGEQVYRNISLDVGANILPLSVPLGASSGDVVARFRYSSTGNLSPAGFALDGEVEDYVVTIDPGNIWQNMGNPLDVNSDGSVSPIDVLRVIQEINSKQASDPTTGELAIPAIEPNTPETVGFVDVNGDGFVSPSDALAVIRAINQITAAAGEPNDLAALASIALPITVDPIGDIVATHPAVEVARQTARREYLAQIQVLEDDDDLVFDQLAEDVAGEAQTSIDEVLAELDFGNLDE